MHTHIKKLNEILTFNFILYELFLNSVKDCMFWPLIQLKICNNIRNKVHLQALLSVYKLKKFP